MSASTWPAPDDPLRSVDHPISLPDSGQSTSKLSGRRRQGHHQAFLPRDPNARHTWCLGGRPPHGAELSRPSDKSSPSMCICRTEGSRRIFTGAQGENSQQVEAFSSVARLCRLVPKTILRLVCVRTTTRTTLQLSLFAGRQSGSEYAVRASPILVPKEPWPPAMITTYCFPLSS